MQIQEINLEDLICVKCKKPIDPNDQFSEIKDFANGKHMRTNFIHKKCFFEGIGMTKNIMGVVEGLTNNLKKTIAGGLQW